MNKTITAILLGLAVCVAVSCVSAGRSETKAAYSPSTPGVLFGKLDNGLTYAIMESSSKTPRFRLVVKAGSIDETADQRGAAHFLEHMAFNGTRSYPGNGLVAELQKSGLSLGAQIKAFTNYEFTEYRLEMPDNLPATTAKALAILRDWADGILLDETEVVSERPVILEEARLLAGQKRALGERYYEESSPELYRARAILGDVESIQAMSSATLRQFYGTWYRPDNMAILVEGYVQPELCERTIASAFDSLKNPELPPPRRASAGPHEAGARAAFAARSASTAGSATLQLSVPLARSAKIGYPSLVEGAERELAMNLLETLLAESVRNSGYTLLRSIRLATVAPRGGGEFLVMEAVVDSARWRESVGLLLSELRRAGAVGADELERVRGAELARWNEIAERGLHPDSWLDALMSWFTNGTDVPSTSDRIAALKDAKASAIKANAKSFSSAFLDEKLRNVLLELPWTEGESDEAAASAALRLALAAPVSKSRQAKSQQASAPVRARSVADLLSEQPTPVKPVKDHQEAGYRTLEYANGLTVALLDARVYDQVTFAYAVPRGGNSLAPDDFMAAILSQGLIPAGGFQDLPGTELRRFLEDNALKIEASVNLASGIITGTANASGLELLLSLLRRTIVSPVVDPLAFEASRHSLLANAKQGTADSMLGIRILESEAPELADRIKYFYNATAINSLTAEACRESFLRLFAPAPGAVLVLNGRFVPGFAALLCDAYLGSIPAASEPPSGGSVKYKIPDGGNDYFLEDGTEGKAEIVMRWYASDAQVDLATGQALAVLALALQRELDASLRESAGGTYSVSAYATTDPNDGVVNVSAEFTCDPKRAKELVALAKSRANALFSGGIDPQTLSALVAAILAEMRDKQVRFPGIAAKVASALASGIPLDNDRMEQQALASLKPEFVESTAKRYLTASKLVVYAVLPREGK